MATIVGCIILGAVFIDIVAVNFKARGN